MGRAAALRAIGQAAALLLAAAAHGQEAPGPADWETPEISARGREAPRAVGPPDGSGLEGAPSPWVQSLDGPWRFQYFPSLDGLPWDFGDPAVDRSAWDVIDVPGCWQMQGFGTPRFAAPGAIGATVDGGAAWAAADNSAAAYVREFTLPESWDGREVFLRFESVQSACYLWVNGEQAGYSEGAGLPAEFRVTPYLAAGANTVAVLVLRWSDADAVRSGPSWNLAGIAGSVALRAEPPVHIRDVTIRTDVPPPYTRATIEVLAEIRSLKPAADTGSVRAELFDADGSAVFNAPFVQDAAVAPGRLTRVVFRAPVASPALWSAESPALYTLQLTLTGGDGQTDVRRVRFGFRALHWQDGALTINGKPLRFAGAVYRPWHPIRGESVPEADLRRDAAMLKQFNFNAVISDEGPLPPAFLSVCDEYGLYVVQSMPAGPAGFRSSALDAVMRVIARDRNRPSAVAWALQGTGAEDLADRVAESDPTRPVMAAAGGAVSALARPSLDDLRRLAAAGDGNRPVVLTAFAANLGNGGGGLADMWDEMLAHGVFHGGFVEAWSDRTLHEAGYRLTADAGRPDRRVVVLGQETEGLSGGGLTRGPAYAAPSTDLDLYHPALTIGAAVRAGERVQAVTLIGKGDQYGLALDGGGNAVFSAAGASVAAPLPEGGESPWRRVAGVYDGEALRLYIDGDLAGEASASGALRFAPVAVAAGETAPGSEPFDGAIDELRIYDRALTAGELAAPAGDDALLALDFDEQRWVGEPWLYGPAGAMDGLVSADRLPRPALWECKKVFEPVRLTVESAEAGKVRIENRNGFLGLDAFAARWRLTADGQAVEEGVIDSLRTAPGAAQSLWIPYSTPRPAPGVTYAVETSFQRAGDLPWAPARHEAAWGSFTLPLAAPRTPAGPAPGPPVLRETDHAIAVTGDGFQFAFSKSQGILTAWEAGGRELIAVGPEINLWRPPSLSGAADAARWRAAGFDGILWELQAIASRIDGAAALVETNLRAETPSGAWSAAMRYRIGGDGALRIDAALTPDGAAIDPPRAGLQLFVPQTFHRLRWTGRGPHETYPGRAASGRFGPFEEDIADAAPPYGLPQEFGNRSGVVRAALVDEAGYGIAAEAPAPFHTGAYPYTPRQLEEARLPMLLEPDPLITWNIDAEMAGIGAGDAPLPAALRLPAGSRTFTVVLRPAAPYNAG